MDISRPTIVIAGAGSIGCYLGGHLVHGGLPVTFLARQRIIEQLTNHGLHLTDYSGFDARLEVNQLTLTEDPACLTKADIILVTVKSNSTQEMADLIQTHARSNAIIVSLQNGINNADHLKTALSSMTVLAGMVPYNVTQLGKGRFHQGTSGIVTIETNSQNVANQLSTDTLRIQHHDNISGVQWGKLLINLNNALNALSGIPLQQQLNQRGWRKLLAQQMDEALPLLKKEGITLIAATPLPPHLAPIILRLPNPIYKLLSNRMPRIDPTARSSMWEDLQQGRKTEIDDLQGAILQLAKHHGANAPINNRILSLIKEAEAAGKGSPNMRSEDVIG